MRTIPFTNIQDISRLGKGKLIIFFGGGNIAGKTHRLVQEYNVHCIVDNASNLWGTFEYGYEVVSPENLLALDKNNILIIITTTSFKDVSIQLSEMGFEAGFNYIVSPVLNDLRIVDELESVNQDIIFSSGSPKVDSPEYGGGIYSMEIKGDTWRHRKVISGNCYGIISFGENFVSVDTELGIFEFSRDYKIIRSARLPAGTRAHGVAYRAESERFYVVGSHLDAVIELDKDFNQTGLIPLSDKLARLGSAYHHCNDCCIVDDSLFISMFSITGNWKRDIFDGGVVEFNLNEKCKVGVVIDGLWMPHNISYISGGLTVLDSLPGYLKKNNAQIVGQFPAFTRGLAFDGSYYYIGQSRNRNFSKNLGVSLNVSIDTGIVIFDESTKVSRMLQLPSRLSEIHSIQIL